MKLYFIVFCLLLSSWSHFAQDSNIYGTWYLVFYEPDTGDPPATYVDPIEPPINPQLTINKDLSFTGEGACNTYSGQFVYLEEFDVLELVEFNHTDNECEFEVHNDFDFLYFNLYWNPFEPYYEYFVHPSGNTLQLIFNFGFEQFYQDTPLSVSDNKKPKAQLYPNPTSQVFKINADASPEAIVTLAGLMGTKLQWKYIKNKGYDVSDLASGIYIITITDNTKQQNFKLVKL